MQGDDISDERKSENDGDGFFTLTDTKKYPYDTKVFLIYESKLLELIKYCMRCGKTLTS